MGEAYNKEEKFKEIDNIIETINRFRQEPLFSNEMKSRQNRTNPLLLSDNELLEIFSYLIAYSQNANSETVEKVLLSGKFNEAFESFEIDKVVMLNPCDIADKHWDSIKGIRQQTKLFHIVSLARKMERIGKSKGRFTDLLKQVDIPTSIRSEEDIDKFWVGFDKLLKIMENHKIPFFRSTTSLLHFLLHVGYDCIKPDLAVMKVALELGIVEKETDDKNLRKAVRFVQEYSLYKGIKPSIVDFYFLIEGGQMGAKKYVTENFYKNK